MTESHYILQDGEYSLWCSRSDGSLVPKDGKFVADSRLSCGDENVVCFRTGYPAADCQYKVTCTFVCMM